MVGKPNPKAKTPRLVIQARNDAEKVLIRKFKEILAEKGTYGIEVVKPLLEAYVKTHWPPNPQLQIPQFTGHLPLSEETLEKLAPTDTHSKRFSCDCGGNRFCLRCGGVGFWFEETK